MAPDKSLPAVLTGRQPHEPDLSKILRDVEPDPGVTSSRYDHAKVPFGIASDVVGERNHPVDCEWTDQW